MPDNTQIDTSVQIFPVIYQWQVSSDEGITSVNIENNQNSPSLTISNATAAQNNLFYRAVVTSGNSVAISNWAKLTTLPPINIISHPTDQIVNAGSASFSANINVPVSASTSYQWEYSNRLTPTIYNPIVGATGLTLNLNNVTENDDDSTYRLKIISAFSPTLQNIKYTNIAKLDFIAANFSIIEEPQNSYVAEGGDSFFSVAASFNEPTTEDLNYQWQESSDGINFQNIAGEISNTLIISSTNKNQYLYRAIISSSMYSITSQTASINTGIELPDANNIVDNTVMWGDPHLRLQSIKGAFANIDDNSSNSPIVFFYVKFLATNESYKLVVENKYNGIATRGPAVISNIYTKKNNIIQTPEVSNGLKSLSTPYTPLIMPSNRCTSIGLAGRPYGLGKCMNLSSHITAQNLNVANFSNLLKNSIKWLSNNITNPKILIIQTTSKDNTLKTQLSSITPNNNITISSVKASSFSNKNNILANVNVVILQHEENNDMSSVGQNALLDFVKLGGSLLVTGGPTRLVTYGKYQILKDVFCVESLSISSYSNKSPLRYIQNTTNTILNNGISQDFSFISTKINFLGTETLHEQAKPGSIIFYNSEQCITGKTEYITNVGNMIDIRDNILSASGWGTYHQPSIKWSNLISFQGKVQIGGALYWILKCIMEYKKNPTPNSKYSIAKNNLVGATIDGYGLMMQPFGITRQMLTNAVNVLDGSAEINKITEEIDLNSTFWKNLSKILHGLTPDDKLYARDIVYYIKQPNNRLTTQGNSVSFEAQALSTKKNSINYQWQISTNNGSSYVDVTDLTRYSFSEDKSILTIKSPNISMNGYKYKVIISTSGSIPKHSQEVILSVFPSLIVQQFPTATSAQSGQAVFQTVASSTNGILRYQWQYSSSVNAGFASLAGQTSATLILNISNTETIKTYHNKYYRVIISNNSSSFTTNPVKLNALPTITINTNPIDTTTNTNTAVFNVTHSYTSPLSNPTITYKWQQSANNRTWVYIANATKSTLTLNNLTRTQNGYYYRVIISVDRVTAISKSARLTILPTLSCSKISTINKLKTISSIDYVDLIMSVNPISTINTTFYYKWQQSINGGMSYSNIAIGDNLNSINVNNIKKNAYSNYRFRVSISNGTDTITVD